MESIEKLHERVEAMEYRGRITERRLFWWRILTCALLVLGLVILPLVGGTAQEQSAYERALVRRLAALEYKLQYITGGANEVVITGANLRIVNGLGATDTTNGLGNLIVGYNELRGGDVPPFSDKRTGSHNVVVGSQNNFSSFGGLVVGLFNEISGEFASVSGGGSGNTASGNFSSVSGGGNNTASGDSSSVSGGALNTASGGASSVSGGFQNKASGGASSVSGGQGNTASANDASSVSGGNGNTASGNFSSVSGGFLNMASGLDSSVSGGSANTASRDVSSVSGGNGNTASGAFASVSGGNGNQASGNLSSVSGGGNNTASGDESSVSGGFNRTAPGQFNWAAGPLFAAQ
jgi:trimeric autotransporter adhesin